MEQEKTCVQKRKTKKSNWKKGKEKGRWKTEVFKKKKKAKTNQRSETRREKGEARKEVCKKRKKGSCSKKEAKKHSFFSKNKCNKKEWKHNLSERRGHFFPTKRFLAQDEDWKNISGFFTKKGLQKKKKKCSIFFLLLLGERNETEEETKTDNENESWLKKSQR